MKYLLVLAVIAVAFWVWRNNRLQNKEGAVKASAKKTAQDTLAQPQPMLQCVVCGVHLPAGEALAGRQGSYCSAAHRAKLEG
jgi:uncharacterized protein